MSGNQVPCPHCAQLIDEDASFCRYCGSSDQDGWRDEYDEADYGEDDFDYDEFVRENFASSPVATQTRPIWKFVAIILLILFLSSVFPLLFG